MNRAQYFCGLGVYGDLYVERPRRVPWSGGRDCDEYLADHPEEQVQEHQVLRVRVSVTVTRQYPTLSPSRRRFDRDIPSYPRVPVPATSSHIGM